MGSIGISFGALSKPLKEQIKEQGFPLPPADTLKRLEARKEAIVTLHLGNVLCDSEAEKARKRLLKQIVRVVELAGNK